MTPQPSYDHFLNRPLPSSEEAERCIIAGILLDNTLVAEAVEQLKPEDFYSPLYRCVFAAMLRLFAAASKIDPIIITEELKRDGSGGPIFEVATITNLTLGIPHFTRLDEYIKIVRTKSQLRRLIRTCNEITYDVLSESDEAKAVFGRAEAAIFDVCGDAPGAGPERIDAIAHASLAKLGQLRNSGQRVAGFETGLVDLDDLTGGFKSGDLIVAAARPSMGKTSLLLQSVYSGTEGDAVGLVFSLEMTKEQCVNRMLAAEANVNLWGLNHGLVPPNYWEKVRDAYKPFRFKNLYIDDRPATTAMQILATARRLKAKHRRLDFIGIDYLQLMASSKRTANRVEEVSQISRDLKMIARDLNVPVVALSQLSRAPEARNPPRPMLSDLRESGSIEQDADLVIFIYREDYYRPTCERQGIAELIVAKHRNGPTGSVDLAWIGSSTKFGNLAHN